MSDAPWAIVCDFDGTAIMGDIADALALRHLGEEQFKRVNAQYQNREMTFRDLLHKLFDPIAASKEEIRKFAHQYTEFRPGLLNLLEVARDRDIPFTFASGGLDIYIHPALELVDPMLIEGVSLRANHAEPIPGGLAVSFPYEHAAGSCGMCGSCKGAIVREFQASGSRVIAI
ncbi:MAG: HAD-IB family phosphatase, partial [Gemmatimonadaceae bacterium]